jgi:hypothetical protein
MYGGGAYSVELYDSIVYYNRAEQGDDNAYCAQLSALYRRYVQNATGRRVDVEALQALDDCSRGKAAPAIPVLEKRLRDAKITPPGGGEFKP